MFPLNWLVVDLSLSLYYIGRRISTMNMWWVLPVSMARTLSQPLPRKHSATKKAVCLLLLYSFVLKKLCVCCGILTLYVCIHCLFKYIIATSWSSSFSMIRTRMLMQQTSVRTNVRSLCVCWIVRNGRILLCAAWTCTALLLLVLLVLLAALRPIHTPRVTSVWTQHGARSNTTILCSVCDDYSYEGSTILVSNNKKRIPRVCCCCCLQRVLTINRRRTDTLDLVCGRGCGCRWR